MLLNATHDPFGAHTGVWMAPEEILHLSAEIAVPAVWTFDASASDDPAMPR
jgi:hypothetical protein